MLLAFALFGAFLLYCKAFSFSNTRSVLLPRFYSRLHATVTYLEPETAVVSVDKVSVPPLYDDNQNSFIDDRVDFPGSPFYFSLLELKDVNRATNLVVDCHYIAPFLAEEMGSRPPVVNPVLKFLNNYFRNCLKRQVMVS